MQRPPSITLFEQLYGGSIILWLLNTAIGWNARQAMIAANPAVAANPQMAGMIRWVTPLSVVVVLAVSLLLLFLVARRGSLVAKWVVTVLTAIGVLLALGALLTLLRGLSPDTLSSVLGLLATALAVAATINLFRPDALPWFGEIPDDAAGDPDYRA